MKKLSFALCIAALILAGTVQGVPLAHAKTTLKMAHMLNPGNSMTDSMEYFAKLVGEKSKDEFAVQIYPSAQLGSDIATIESLLKKQIEIAAIGNMNVSVYTDEFAWTSLPYIFKDIPSMQKVMNSSFMEETKKKVEETTNLKILFLVDSAAPLHAWFAKKQVRVPADMAGMKIRASASPLQQDLIRALGANPTTTTWPETYMAIEQGVAEGMVCDYLWIYSAKLEEVNRYVTDMPAVMMTTFLLVCMNKEEFYSYPEAVRNMLLEAGKEAQQYSHKVGLEAAKGYIQYGKDAGVTIYTPTPEEMKLWVEAGRSIWPQYTTNMSKEFLDGVIKFQEQ